MGSTRRTTILVTAALVWALGFLPARSNSAGVRTKQKDTVSDTGACSKQQQGYKYCGQHWRLGSLPIHFHLNLEGVPGSISPEQFQQAAKQSAATWNQASKVSGTGPSGSCGASAKLLCIDSADRTGALDAGDRTNVILWSNLGKDGPYGLANVYAPDGKHILDVDIVLNNADSWFWSDPVTATLGTWTGPAAFLCPGCASDAADLQSILTHELGHALGLLHPKSGDPNMVWPENSEDAQNYNQVMYQAYYPNNATQRTLQSGDRAGLDAVTTESQSDSKR